MDELRKEIVKLTDQYLDDHDIDKLDDGIVSLFTQHQERVIERLEKEKRQAWLRSKAAGQTMPYSMNIGDRGWNKAIDKAISILREEMK
jgi:hypothetical protein